MIVIQHLVLPTGRYLETLRRLTEDLWIVAGGWWSGLKKELLGKKKKNLKKHVKL